MSTHREEHSKGKPAAKKPHDLHDDHSGVYGWFRRHQKKLLYSVGLFVLITFSVSGPMVAAVTGLFAKPKEMPRLHVGGIQTALTSEDYDIGRQIANRTQVLSAVLPPIGFGEGGRSDLNECYAILRRAAIAEGLDFSLAEVDRAMEMLMEGGSIESPTQLARQFGFASLAACRQLFGEAMRIGTLLRLQTLTLDSSEAKILNGIIKDREKITFRAATFDEKKLQEELEAAEELSFEDLKAWLDGKDENEKARLGVFAPNRAALDIGAVMLDQFVRDEWKDELEGFVVGDKQKERYYNIEKEARFKNEDGTYRELGSEDVDAELTTLLEAEHAMVAVFRKISEQRTEWCKEAADEMSRASSDLFETKNKITELEQKVQDDPKDEEAAGQLAFEKENVLPQRERQKEEAEKAYNDRYAAFDFLAAFKEVTEGKTGIVTRSFTDLRAPEQLKDLDAGGLGLGSWSASKNASFHARIGDFSFNPQRTTKAVMLYRVNALELRPLKPKEELEPLLHGAYFTEKAKEQGDAARKKLEEALVRLARARAPEEFEKIENSRQSRIDEKLSAWEEKTQAGIDRAKAKLADEKMSRLARADWENNLRELEARLAQKAAKEAEFGREVDAEIEKEIAEAVEKQYQYVLDEAAAEAGFAVADVGPLPRDVKSQPRFADRYDPTAVYLFRSHGDLDLGDATGVEHDTTERRWIAAWCKDAEALTYADVTRREFEMARKGGFFGGGGSSYASQQAGMAYMQAFTKEALEKRYSIERPMGTQVEGQ